MNQSFLPAFKTKEELAAIQLAGLQWTVRHAWEGSPFYRKRLSEAGLEGDITICFGRGGAVVAGGSPALILATAGEEAYSRGSDIVICPRCSIFLEVGFWPASCGVRG